MPESLKGDFESNSNKKVDSNSKGSNQVSPGLMPSMVAPQAKKTKKKDKKESDCIISGPNNFRQPVHVDFNSETGFSGLPKEWENLIKGNISEGEWQEHSEIVAAVIEFQQRGMVPAAPKSDVKVDAEVKNEQSEEEAPEGEEEGNDKGGAKLRSDKVHKRRKGDLGEETFSIFFRSFKISNIFHFCPII